MKIVELPINALREAPWNANRMKGQMLAHLRESIKRYGQVENLVVRKRSDTTYEVLSGNQRLKLLIEMGFTSVPCVVVKLNDAHARLLSQALNHIRGDDDLGLRAEMVRKILETIPESDVAAILPDTTETLRALANLGQNELGNYILNKIKAQAARFSHLHFQLTDKQMLVIEKALDKVTSKINDKNGDTNLKGEALYVISKFYLEKNHDD